MCIRCLFQFLAHHGYLINVNSLPPIFQFNKCVWNVRSVPSTILGTADTNTKKKKKATVSAAKGLLVQGRGGVGGAVQSAAC